MQRVRLLLLTLLSLSVLWYGGKTGYLIYRYYALTERADATKIEWKIKKKRFERYYPAAEYLFTLNDELIKGQTDFIDFAFRSPEACAAFIVKAKKNRWWVWFAPHNAKHYSSLRKVFPWKELIYSLIILLITIHFIWLGIYIGKLGR